MHTKDSGYAERLCVRLSQAAPPPLLQQRLRLQIALLHPRLLLRVEPRPLLHHPLHLPVHSLIHCFTYTTRGDSLVGASSRL